ncbi:Homocitrate synthase [Dehalobacter sp. UNSWDHB]|jgi:homocitrate synthase NifV|uniref:homocitrate synthase n=1 Tax=unclassified Dehalobacter TaxID=2635733 RepID=UPI00028A9F0B|nr:MULTISPECIES: homocitrate synthase [unclassified Dehalobacter]AFV02432.1 Homocitrate synthase [Dehalobacter sp. DCA]AFV05421.1 Homocitrate synthase [Dehalobacter sp. CF]EQB22312.1 Homocitrate synthase [Dehalobacter sp. UNSWDHB]
MGKVPDTGLVIVDTTLRDGEQTAGVVFSNQEKLRIARMLDEIGVNQIEAGIPIMGGKELEAIKGICGLGLKASIMGWNRAVIKDIEASLSCGCDAVAISVSTSDIHIKHKLKTTPGAVLDMMIKATEFAKKHVDYISVNAEDASRSDMNYLVEFATEAKKAGANRLRYCDTIGILDPFLTFDRIKTLRERADIDVEMHTHNDFGMATANALAGVKAGARFIGVTVNGLGERAGNAALEEVIMALKYLEETDLGFVTERFVELSEYVSRASGRILPPWKAIVGSNMFAHESGIHADGALKNPKTYEVFRPEEVGLERQIVIGKHSGTASIKAKFREYGRELTSEQADKILKHVRSLAVDMKRSLFDKELIYIYKDLYGTEKEVELLSDGNMPRLNIHD